MKPFIHFHKYLLLVSKLILKLHVYTNSPHFHFEVDFNFNISKIATFILQTK